MGLNCLSFWDISNQYRIKKTLQYGPQVFQFSFKTGQLVRSKDHLLLFLPFFSRNADNALVFVLKRMKKKKKKTHRIGSSIFFLKLHQPAQPPLGLISAYLFNLPSLTCNLNSAQPPPALHFHRPSEPNQTCTTTSK